MTRRRFDPSLYLVTDPAQGGDRPLAEVVAAAVQGGVTLVQLRDKAAGARALLEQARALQARRAPCGGPLVGHGRVDAVARALLGPEAILGVSLDAVDQAAAVDPAAVDYVAHGPFAATATKADAGGPVGAAGLAAVRRRTALPLVAIGGIDSTNAGLAIGAGADGVAVVSAIVAAADPAAAARELRAAITAARPEQRRRGA